MQNSPLRIRRPYTGKLLFYGYEDLLRKQVMNGVVDLRGIKVTELQLDELRNYIASQEIWRLLIRRISLDEIIFVQNVNDTNIVT
jgi:hypothetical protein